MPRLLIAAFGTAIAGVAAGGGGSPRAPGPPKADWPTDPRGLLFLWRNGRSSNTIAPGDDGVPRPCRLTGRGMARWGRFHDLLPAGGRFVADEDAVALAEALRKANEMSFEAVLTAPRESPAAPSAVMALVADRTRRLVLAHDGDHLALLCEGRTQGRRSLRLAPLPPGQPQHVVVAFAPGRKEEPLVAYVNGRRAGAAADAPVDFSTWRTARLSLGGEQDEGGWHGRMECIALYHRALGGSEAAANHKAAAASLQGRTPAATLVVQAKLLAKARLPDPDNYPLALVVYRYAVVKATAGAPAAGELLVAHWAVINGRVQRAIRDRPAGSTHRLVLHRFADHPELTALRISEPPGELDLPRFFDAGQDAPQAPRPPGDSAPNGPVGPATSRPPAL